MTLCFSGTNLLEIFNCAVETLLDGPLFCATESRDLCYIVVVGFTPFFFSAKSAYLSQRERGSIDRGSHFTSDEPLRRCSISRINFAVCTRHTPFACVRCPSLSLNSIPYILYFSTKGAIQSRLSPLPTELPGQAIPLLQWT